jgi:hypothetical protein
MKWNTNFVIFEAKAIFSANIQGKNTTFVPFIEQIEHQANIPIDRWNMTSPDDEKSHLLQGKSN